MEEMKNLIEKLNKASSIYYNTDLKPIMTDKEWDDLYDKLKQLEKKYGVVFANSPTQNIGYEVKSNLEKVNHKYPLKSLNKTKDINELNNFLHHKEGIMMLKLDGLTIDVIFENGILMEGSTRGNGNIGENITHNVKTFTNLPTKINYKGRVEVVGEAIILYDIFNNINKDKRYKNPRNLVAGSVRQLDNKICKQRKVKLITYNVLGIDFKTKLEELQWLKNQGFEVVDYICIDDLEKNIDKLKNIAFKKGIPIDGLVITFNDKQYGNSLGNTAHHPNHSLAFKFYEDVEETVLRDVKWQVGRTGIITPVASFDTVELAGTDVSKASIHNLKIIKELKLGLGDTITVFKANEIIPQIKENITQSDNLEIPTQCPVCGHDTKIKISDKAEFLYCNNENCKAKLIQKIKHYCSREAMNINGLSEKTIEKFIQKGFLNEIADIYKLQDKKEIMKLDGFGRKSFYNLIESIENSKKCKLENFIFALGIPNIGKTTAQSLVQFIPEDNSYVKINAIRSLTKYDLLKMKDCGEVLANSIIDWFNNKENIDIVKNILQYIEFIEDVKKDNKIIKDNLLKNKKVYPTGKFELKKNDLKVKLKELGAIVESGYKKSLDYLITANDTSKSSKVDKAKKDNIKIMTESELMKIIEEN